MAAQDCLLIISNHDVVSDLLGLNFSDYSSLLPLDKSYVPTSRTNMDAKSNNNGGHVIDLCKSLGLAIVNGRLRDDFGIGKFTFQ